MRLMNKADDYKDLHLVMISEQTHEEIMLWVYSKDKSKFVENYPNNYMKRMKKSHG